MHVLVTGCAGFIGSHTSERLLAEGHRVRGVDSFTDYYDPALKHRNLEQVREHPDFELRTADLGSVELHGLLDGIDGVVHLAGQPGVRASWADGFAEYVTRNIDVTQRLLEAARSADLQRFVAASSSSVYGDADTYPTTEDALPRPVSPYGVTKLAAEHLCTLYATNFGVPTVSMRYFTVYGPRQRPDMALRRMIDLTLEGRPFQLFGDGSTSRSFTYVDDVVDANLAALTGTPTPGSAFNIANESTTSMSELLELVGECIGRPVEVDRHPSESGDARRTGGSSASARAAIGWAPRTELREGIRRMVDWCRDQRSTVGDRG